MTNYPLMMLRAVSSSGSKRMRGRPRKTENVGGRYGSGTAAAGEAGPTGHGGYGHEDVGGRYGSRYPAGAPCATPIDACVLS